MKRLEKGGSSVRKALRDWWQALEHLILPPVPLCGLCGEQPRLPVGACRGCLDSLAISWQGREVEGHLCFSLFPYQGYGRDLIHRMKFQRGYQIAFTLGFFMGLAAREEPALAQVDILVPVPLSPGRLEKRGFNQAALLADNIRGVWKRQVCAAAVRTRETKSQSGLSLTERKRNVQGAFALLPGFDLRKKTCLIVDDVITSGNTFSALARLIEDYGGRPMGIFAARTEISSRSDVDAEKL